MLLWGDSATASEKTVPATHLGFKRNDFQNHLNSEHPREDHVQNVHGVIKHLGLLIVLWTTEAQFSEAPSRLAKGGSPALHSPQMSLLRAVAEVTSTVQHLPPRIPQALRGHKPSPKVQGGLDKMRVTG